MTNDTNNPVNQSKLEIFTCSRCKARENVFKWVTIGFNPDWMKNGANFLSQSWTDGNHISGMTQIRSYFCIPDQCPVQSAPFWQRISHRCSQAPCTPLQLPLCPNLYHKLFPTDRRHTLPRARLRCRPLELSDECDFWEMNKYLKSRKLANY